ncbi:hypothetical protein ACPCXD_16765 [Rhodococcus sp. AB351]
MPNEHIEQADNLLDLVLGLDPGLTRELPPVAVILEYVIPHILRVRDDGNGNLRQLPIIGTSDWHRASDGIKWATVALAALQGLWAAERGPEERIAYIEGADRVDLGLDWATYAYQEGYDKGRRDQKAIDRRAIRRNPGAAA